MKTQTRAASWAFLQSLLRVGGAGLLFTATSSLPGQDARFFRVSGPAPTAITKFLPDGRMVWSNAQPGATYTIQAFPSVTGEANWVDYAQIRTASGIHTNQVAGFNTPAGMVFIPQGSFTIGDTLDNDSEARPTNVTVSAYYIETNLVTYSLWQSVYAWATSHGYTFTNSGSGKGPNHPVHSVNWFDAVKWCNARSEQEGLTPVYYDGFLEVYKTDQIEAIADWEADGYRLPTEAEWEKAARGGLSGKRFPWGNTISRSQANYSGDTGHFSYDLGPDGHNPAFATGAEPYTSPVGSFPPNGYGLYDMAGNLLQWCWDFWWSPYEGGTDPHGADGKTVRVLRGGGWWLWPSYATCARRIDVPPDASYYYGFRCVRRF